jgi:branched-chain amino acid transport system ATP-binding protein
MALLELRGVSKYFGGLPAVSGLDMDVMQGEILGLIGPNGAGKTTVFNVITGFLRLDRGKVVFDGKDISGLEPHFIAKRGIVRTFQLTTLFSGLTVLENMLAGLHLLSRIGFWEALFNTGSNHNKEKELREKATEILTFAGLVDVRDEPAMNLPHGHQQVLSLCVALAASPKILLLDEPLSGMNPKEVMTMIDIIRKIRNKEELSIVVVEHNMRAVMSLCERIIVVNFGRKIAEGAPEEIRENQDVIDAYLGVEANAT